MQSKGITGLTRKGEMELMLSDRCVGLLPSSGAL